MGGASSVTHLLDRRSDARWRLVRSIHAFVVIWNLPPSGWKLCRDREDEIFVLGNRREFAICYSLFQRLLPLMFDIIPSCRLEAPLP